MNWLVFLPRVLQYVGWLQWVVRLVRPIWPRLAQVLRRPVGLGLAQAPTHRARPA
ncbi:MAG: hypothetical protein K6T31_04220 [Alicyclobacillus sp.]|nr:hypothetical protein [Alicyclobacillus sp.]